MPHISSARSLESTSSSRRKRRVLADAQGRSVYIVSMSGAAPASVYAASGGIGLFSTDSNRAPLPSDSFLVRSYEQRIRARQENVLLANNLGLDRMVKRFTYAVNGFTALLSPQEASRLQQDPAVARIEPSKMMRKLTTAAPQFMNLPSTIWEESGGPGKAGEGVVIGLIDTGIWPENPAFVDDVDPPYGAPPAKWRGSCTNGTACSKKLIGARYFLSTLTAVGFSVDQTRDFVSPRDADGHGSHTSSIAAGNYNFPVSVGTYPFSYAYGQGSGVAPRAFLAMYKVLWTFWDGGELCEGTGYDGDIIDAINQAAKDGVDVISMSLGGDDAIGYFELSDLALLTAYQLNIVSVAAAGNEGSPTGKGQYTKLCHNQPWTISAAASTLASVNSAQVTLGSGLTFEGRAGVGGPLGPLPLIDAATAAALGASISRASLCFNNSLSPAKVMGKLVLCLGGTISLESKVNEVRRAGGAGAIISSATTNSSLSDWPFPLPMVHVSKSSGIAILAYIYQDLNATASISPTYRTAVEGPSMATFSSAGPLVNPSASSKLQEGPTNDILKPDITAPGVGIMAASTSGMQNTWPLFQMLSGTSMSTPAIAGIAALIKQKYPSWNPGAVKSAIQSTAYTLNNRNVGIKLENGTSATPFNYGFGHVNASRVLNPGLVFEASAREMWDFLSGINKAQAKRNMNLFGYSGVATAREPWALNLPSVVFSRFKGSRTTTRRVTSVTKGVETYTAIIVEPAGVSVVVAPMSFTIAPNGKQSYTVTMVAIKATKAFAWGSITWQNSNGSISVRTLLGAQPIALK